jgi:alpha-L-fucosidase
VHLTVDSAGPVVHIRSVELLPVNALARERQEALQHRANTDWLARSGYGVMVHWTSQTQPRHGRALSYASAVHAFDVEKFTHLVATTGAAYLIFAVNHVDPHCPAPIRAWESAHPGWTTQRDLLGELARSLNRQHIRLILYVASPGLGNLGKVSAARYLQIHQQVLDEIGTRYGSLVAGYWFDGWYPSSEAYPEISPRDLSAEIRRGNPQRVVAYNYWVYPPETEWQDYWAGEVGDVVKPTLERFVSLGPAHGLQSHNLVYLDAPWVHGAPDTDMELPRFSDAQLIEFVRTNLQHGGATTLNLGIYQDGTVGEQTLRQMMTLRRAIRGQ